MKTATQSNTKRVVILARASSTKQAIEGETLGMQVDQLQRFSDANNWEIVKLESIIESGRKQDRDKFDSLISFCVDRKNKIDILLVKNIDRLSRQGADAYLKLKNKLKNAGVDLVDIEGVIRGEKNTLEDLNFEYEWSKYNPSRSNEIAEAEEALKEARKILTRTISHEIKYTQQGYWSRNSVFGYKNQKIDTEENGRRNILVEKPDEAFFIRKMFELKAHRKYSDQDVVDELNRLGFKSRILARRDKETQKKIGTKGGNPLTTKQLQRYLQRLVYAGVIKEKWTHDQPVLAQFEGLVSIDLFNKANEGKIYLENVGDQITIKENYSPWAVKRNKRNPLYPYKNVVLCPECGNALLGSASTGSSGQKFPSYHCSRNHKRFSKKPKEIDDLVEATISQLEFSEGDGKLFKECFMVVYAQRKSEATVDSVKYSQTLDEMKLKQDAAYQTVKTTSSDSVRARAEKEYDELEDKILNMGDITAKKEQKELKARQAYKKAAHLMEHLEEVLIDKENVLNQEMLFRLAFKELPTYEDLVNGTLNLHPLFKLKSSALSSKRQCVTPRGIEPRLPG